MEKGKCGEGRIQCRGEDKGGNVDRERNGDIDRDRDREGVGDWKAEKTQFIGLVCI